MSTKAFGTAAWERTDKKAGTTFTLPDGERMLFDRGRVWLVYKKA